MTKLEQIARAIWDAEGSPGGKYEYCVHDRFEKAARAAIEAMQEPTAETINAGAANLYSGLLSADSALAVWQSMIDAILNEKAAP